MGSCGWEGGIPQGRQSWTLWALHRQKQKLAQSPGDRGVGQGSDSVHVGREYSELWRPSPEPSSAVPASEYQLSAGKEGLALVYSAGACGHALV